MGGKLNMWDEVEESAAWY